MGSTMIQKRNIFLIGPMGSGKTAVGRQLARLFKLTFYDSDADIETKTGVDIAFIFEKEGEQGFRVRERESIDRLTQMDAIVLATGGGAVIEAENRRVLRERGVVVYLQTSVDQQLERTRHARHRPLLNDTDPEQTLAALMQRRAQLYAEIAARYRRTVAACSWSLRRSTTSCGAPRASPRHEDSVGRCRALALSDHYRIRSSRPARRFRAASR